MRCTWQVAACLTLLIAAAFPAPSRADELQVNGSSLHRVQVVGYARGEVEIVTATGERDLIPLHEIELMVLDSVTGVADFNQAEELMVKRQAAQAVERYERAVRAARGFWASMARVRLLAAADLAGNLEKTVRAWLDVLAEDPETAAVMLPQTKAQERTPANQRTLKRLENALDELTEEDARTLVALLHFDILRSISDRESNASATRVARQTLPAKLMTARTITVKLEALRTELSAGRYDDVLASVDAMIPDAPEAHLPELLLVKSRAQLMAARNDRERLRAALPALRVVIHFPNCSLAGEGLLLAADAHTGGGRSADAERLLRECLRRSGVPEQVKEQARAQLAALTKASE